MEPVETALKNTYIVARASGDQQYMYWLYDRLTLVYKEDENIDFVQTLSGYCAYFNRRANVPWWLNWILRKYNL